MLSVGDGHQLHVEECGNPNGLPIIFLLVVWMKKYAKSGAAYSKAAQTRSNYFFISHDTELLNQTCDYIVDLGHSSNTLG